MSPAVDLLRMILIKECCQGSVLTKVNSPLLQNQGLPKVHCMRSMRLNPVQDPWQLCVAPIVRPPAQAHRWL